MRLKRSLILEERPVKVDADPIFQHFAIASLIFAIIGAIGAILSMSLCLNASPLKEFIATEYNKPNLMYSHNFSTTSAPSTTSKENSESITNFTVTSSVNLSDPVSQRQNNQEDTLNNTFYELYREEVKSWMTWQDSFVLSVFILLILLSIGAIVAFKVLLVGLN